ncbi:DinB family protein [Kitasatospora kazusensis]|uniref:DinB family protein n=1 Tax=Kitasatospora kazusensis TaxID=407974 RepID=A0ABN2ZL85_9ACTN
MITPDTKDWTWVLQRPCGDCGLDTATLVREELAGAVRAEAAAWAALLTGSPAVVLRRRPSPEVWSDLEYACHVRDVLRLFGHRLELMLTEDAPCFADWDQDETAVAERYGEQDPAVVATELAAAGERMVAVLTAVSGERWQRRADRSDGARFTVESLSRYVFHDVAHHLFDVTGVSRRTPTAR